MTDFQAYHLPVAAAGTDLLRTGDLVCRYPRPEPRLYQDVLEHLREAGRALADRPVLELVEVIDAAAARFLDPHDPLRQEAERLLPAATGYSGAMVRLVLDRMAADWRAAPLRALLQAELGDPAVLDGFVQTTGGDTVRATGPRLAFHVFAGNVPGVAVTALVRSLLVKAPTLAKTASGEPVLPVLFARALAAVDPDTAAAVAVSYWPGGAEAVEAVVLDTADTVVAYGGEQTVDSLRKRIPHHTRLVVHGPRFSIGLIGAHDRPADLGPLARSVALATATFDQQGCVSPHAVWFEDPAGDATTTFARAVADAFAALEADLPRGRIAAAEASAIHQARGAAELRAHSADAPGASPGARPAGVFASAGTAWTVVHAPTKRFQPSCLNRFLHIHPVPDLDEAIPLLEPVGRHLQSVAIHGAGPRLPALAHRLGRLGATRITTFDRLPWPRPTWHHDGRGPLRELIRWVDLER